MAAASIGFGCRMLLGPLGSLAARSKPAARPIRRLLSFARLPVELGCCGGSLFPLHSATAAARMTSRLSLSSRSLQALSQGFMGRTFPGP